MARSPSSISSSEGRRFLVALALLAGPFALALAAELWVLPLDAFASRAWEALLVRRHGPTFGLTGPFYPDRRLVIAEQPDLIMAMPMAERRRAEWRTDAFGFRADDAAGDPADIVIVGDSLVAGARLTQDDTIAGQLARRLHRRVYPYAPAQVGECLVDRRFAGRAPRVVVLMVFERTFPYLAPADPAGIAVARRSRDRGWRSHPAWRRLKAASPVRAIAVTWNRVHKANGLRWTRARVRELWSPPPARIKAGPMYFLEGAPANTELPDAAVERVAELLVGYRNACAADGIRFVFAPIPNKETIHWRWLGSSRAPSSLRRVIDCARRAGVETVDLLWDYEKASAAGTSMYHLDDTHWNADGVRVAAIALAGALRVP